MDNQELELLLSKHPFLSLNDAVYKLIFDKIVSLDFLPDYQLKEKEIAESLFISRTPVNYALKKLEDEELIIKEKKKYLVAPLKIEQCLKLYESRIGIEGYAAYLCADRITLRQLKELEDVSEKYYDCIKNTPEKQAYYDEKFHDLIIQASNNHYITAMYCTSSSQLLRYRNYISKFALNGKINDILKQAAKDHRSIINAIKFRFCDVARSQMEHHIGTMYTAFLNWDSDINKIK